MQLTILTQTRNTAHRLEEWVRFHAAVGADSFLIYLDNPGDNAADILEKLSADYTIEYHVLPPDGDYLDGPFNGRSGPAYQAWRKQHTDAANTAPHLSRQLASVRRGVMQLQQQHKGGEHWTAFIDVDEYLVPQKTDDLKKIINRYAPYYRRIVAFDYRFALPQHAHHPIIPQALVRRPISNAVQEWPTRKSIINTHFCLNIECLHDLDNSPYLMIDDEIKMNHYRLESSFSPDSYFIEDRRALELCTLKGLLNPI